MICLLLTLKFSCFVVSLFYCLFPCFIVYPRVLLYTVYCSRVLLFISRVLLFIVLLFIPMFCCFPCFIVYCSGALLFIYFLFPCFIVYYSMCVIVYAVFYCLLFHVCYRLCRALLFILAFYYFPCFIVHSRVILFPRLTCMHGACPVVPSGRSLTLDPHTAISHQGTQEQSHASGPASKFPQWLLFLPWCPSSSFFSFPILHARQCLLVPNVPYCSFSRFLSSFPHSSSCLHSFSLLLRPLLNLLCLSFSLLFLIFIPSSLCLSRSSRLCLSTLR